MRVLRRTRAAVGAALLLTSSLLPIIVSAQPVTVERVGYVCRSKCSGIDYHFDTYAPGATRFYFSADNGASGYEPWAVNILGGAPAQMLADIQPGSAGSNPGTMRTVGDILFFQAYTPAGGGWTEGRRLWRSDGTPAGTLPVDFPAPEPKSADLSGSDAIIGTSRGVLVQALNALWWVDPDGSAPRKILDTRLHGHRAVEWQGGIYFVAGACSYCAGDQTPKLYRFNPPGTLTPLGPLPVAVPPSYADAPVSIAAMTAGIVVMPDSTNLWFSDGSGPPVARYQWLPNWRATVQQSQESAGLLLFPVVDDVNAAQIWSTDGSASGTRPATHFPPLGYLNGPWIFGGVGGRIVLSVTTSNLGYYPDAPSYPWYPALWMFDASQPLGAHAIHSLGSANGYPQPQIVGMLGSRMLLQAWTDHVAAGDRQPSKAYWITDGTTNGTAEISLAALGGNPLYPMAVAGGWMYTWGWVDPIGNDLFRFRIADDFPTKYPTVDVVEYFHADFNHYFMTGSSVEQALLDAGAFSGWQRTGFGFVAYAAGSGAPSVSPVCRFYGRPEAGIDSHFYSAMPSECAAVEQNYASSWRKESSNVFEVSLPNLQNGWCPDATTPLYRAFNGKANANHRYSIDTKDQNAMQVKGWQPEGLTSAGIVMCVPVTTRNQ